MAVGEELWVGLGNGQVLIFDVSKTARMKMKPLWCLAKVKVQIASLSRVACFEICTVVFLGDGEGGVFSLTRLNVQ